MNERILIVDDEEGMRLALREVLTRKGYRVELARNGQEGLERLQNAEHESGPIQLALSDVKMPLLTGIELLKALAGLPAAPPLIIMTAFGTIEDAVEAMRLGARDYLMKPFSSSAVEVVVERVLREETELRITNNELQKANEELRLANCELQLANESAHSAFTDDPQSLAAPGGDENGAAARALAARPNGDAPCRFIAVDESTKQLQALARDVAASDASILILGESGTGKEVMARFIHQHSPRAEGPFIAVNCAAVPEGLLESELFGHIKGSFTGALIDRKGHFELANHGTLLLDEISEMPLALQAKLLRVLQEREITPVGADRSTRLDIRVIATSNRSMEMAVKDGDFREDLYYRLNVIALELPPLRQRKGDILPLAEFFVRRHCQRNRRELKKVSRELERFMLDQPWRGNVRELENFLERAVLLCKDAELKPENIFLPALSGAYGREMPAQQVFGAEASAAESFGREAKGSDGVKDNRNIQHEDRLDYGATAPQRELTVALSSGPTMTLEEMERKLILSTLEKVNGNRTRAADLLGVSVRTIRNKLNQYNLPASV